MKCPNILKNRVPVANILP